MYKKLQGFAYICPENPVKSDFMVGNFKTPQGQLNLFKRVLVEFIDPSHELVQLAQKINWKRIEENLSRYYSHTGNPSHPIRLMAGLLILKHMKNHSDEGVVKTLAENPYYQYFCGLNEFCWGAPLDPSNLVHFRKKIKEEGCRCILRESVLVHGEEGKDTSVVSDTTAQPKNITYPTDAKLYAKVIDGTNRIAQKEGIKIRQSYVRIKKQLLKQAHSKNKTNKEKAIHKLKRIARKKVEELKKLLNEEQKERYAKEIEVYERVINQTKDSKDKVYSVHEPEVSCIAKGKSGKPYEYGSKVSILSGSKTGLIYGVETFKGNPHDSKTIEPTIKMARKILPEYMQEVKVAYVDRAYVNGVIEGIEVKKAGTKGKDAKECSELRKGFRRRSGIEALISHVKHGHRMLRNYLKGVIGDRINAILSCAGWNFKKMLIKLASLFFVFIFEGKRGYKMRLEMIKLV